MMTSTAVIPIMPVAPTHNTIEVDFDLSDVTASTITEWAVSNPGSMADKQSLVFVLQKILEQAGTEKKFVHFTSMKFASRSLAVDNGRFLRTELEARKFTTYFQLFTLPHKGTVVYGTQFYVGWN